MHKQMHKQPTLLILDPHLQFSRLLKKRLHEVGCNVIAESDANKALSALEQHKPDWILLELEFKSQTGFDVCKEIKCRPQFKHIPILFHTKDATRKNIIRSLEVGGSSFIVKPASRDTLVRKLNEVSKKLGWEEEFQFDATKPFGFVSKSTSESDQDDRLQVTFSEDMDSQTKVALLLDNAQEVKAMPFTIARILELISTRSRTVLWHQIGAHRSSSPSLGFILFLFLDHYPSICCRVERYVLSSV